MAEIIDTSSSSSLLTIRLTDNGTGTGQNVEVDFYRNANEFIPALALAGDGPLRRDGYITSVELQNNFQEVNVSILIEGQQVGIATPDNNSITLPSRVPLDIVSLQVIRI